MPSNEKLPVPGSGFSIDARRLYDGGQIDALAFHEAGGGIVISDEALIETDADGCGYPYGQDVLAGDVQIRKEFLLDSPAASAASLLICHVVEKLWTTPAHDAPAVVSVNGQAAEVTLKVGWNTIEIDPALLRAGRNEIVLSTPPGAAPAIIPFARREDILDNAPWRAATPTGSFKSAGGGKNWSPKLGVGDITEGEYNIRLRLRRFAPMGECTSPVIDLADPDGKQPLKSLAAVRSVSLVVQSDCPPGTAVVAFLRTGQTPILQAEAWEPWRLLCTDRPLCPRGRYGQVKVVLTTTDGREAPVLRGLEVTSEVEFPHAASGAIRTLEFNSHPLVRPSRPFECEPLNHPLLAELRRKHKLDEVVAGAATQFERIVRLNHWVSQQWDWHPPEVRYPEWNALEILERQADGKPLGGFCGQYAIVMVQCCLAMGMQARFVFGCTPGVISGHEVAEVWSDEYGKWVLMDPNMDRHYLDRATKVPMNMMDLHRALLDHFFPRGLGSPEENKAAVSDAAFAEYERRGPVIVFGGHNAGPDWFDGRRAHLMWGHPMMMPRSSFFSRPRPMPRQHGYGMIWSWNGYRHWAGSRTPPQDRFGGQTDRPGDFYWNLNQVELHLEETAESGVLRVTAGYTTPDLDALLVSLDGGEWGPSPDAFFWRLKKGENSLRVKTRNVLGVEGAESLARVVRDA